MTKSVIAIAGISAVQFWLDFSRRINPDMYSHYICERVALPDHINAETDPSLITLVLSELGLVPPLNIMVSGPSARHYSKYIHFLIRPAKMPKNSFIKLEPQHLPSALRSIPVELYVASPEYCFMYMANKLPFHLLTALGCNLCANYAFDSRSELGQLFRDPITSPSLIADYVYAAVGAAGRPNSLRALKYICSGSNSPMETSLAVIAVLPLSEGGYNLTKPCLNQKVIISRAAAESSSIQSCSCDLVWEEAKLIIEYDSDMTHLDKDQHAYDKAKSNALNDSGYTLINLTSSNVKNFPEIEKTFDKIRGHLQERNRYYRLEKYENKRKRVFSDLFLDRSIIWLPKI